MVKRLEELSSEEILDAINSPCNTSYVNQGIQILADRGYKEATPRIQDHLDWTFRYLHFYAKLNRPKDSEFVRETKSLCEKALKKLQN